MVLHSHIQIFSGYVANLAFTLPQGATGPQGPQGIQGATGATERKGTRVTKETRVILELLVQSRLLPVKQHTPPVLMIGTLSCSHLTRAVRITKSLCDFIKEGSTGDRYASGTLNFTLRHDDSRYAINTGAINASGYPPQALSAPLGFINIGDYAVGQGYMASRTLWGVYLQTTGVVVAGITIRLRY